MIERFCIVVDALGFKVCCSPMINDTELYEHELQEGEQIIEKDWAIANTMNKPRWDFDNMIWVDIEPLTPVEPVPTPVDKTRIWQSKMEAGMAELALQTARNSLFKN